MFRYEFFTTMIRQMGNSACCSSLTCVKHKYSRCPQVGQHKLDLRLAAKCDFTCMRFMASRIWSRWWAELSASRRMSVNLSSFSLSSFFSWRTISASASVHSHSLQRGLHTGRRRGVTLKGHTKHSHNPESKNTQWRSEGSWSQWWKPHRQVQHGGEWETWTANPSHLQSSFLFF